MCLAVPVRIISLEGNDAVLEIDGIRRHANVALIPDAGVGDCVLLHAGFAIRKWSEQDLREYHEILNETNGRSSG
jgi:hydrogenase expression/formation protein HypC